MPSQRFKVFKGLEGLERLEGLEGFKGLRSLANGKGLDAHKKPLMCGLGGKLFAAG